MTLQGAKTSGRIPREATLKLSLSLSTALSGEATTSQLFRDSNDAAAGSIDVAGAAAAAATEQYQAAVRLQNMTGQVCQIQFQTAWPLRLVFNHAPVQLCLACLSMGQLFRAHAAMGSYMLAVVATKQWSAERLQ